MPVRAVRAHFFSCSNILSMARGLSFSGFLGWNTDCTARAAGGIDANILQATDRQQNKCARMYAWAYGITTSSPR